MIVQHSRVAELEFVLAERVAAVGAARRLRLEVGHLIAADTSGRAQVGWVHPDEPESTVPLSISSARSPRPTSAQISVSVRWPT